jgi:hypothetical protein
MQKLVMMQTHDKKKIAVEEMKIDKAESKKPDGAQRQ